MLLSILYIILVGISMNLKKFKIISIFGIFTLTVLFHFAYNFYPNFLFATIFPVNESIWEHMKLLYFGILFYQLIEYFLLSKNKIKYNNKFSNLFITTYSSVFLYLIIYLPIYNVIGENMIVSILLLIIIIIVESIISYYILKSKQFNKSLEIFSILLLIIGYIVFIYLTFNPPTNYLFYDIVNKTYGIVRKLRSTIRCFFKVYLQ